MIAPFSPSPHCVVARLPGILFVLDLREGGALNISLGRSKNVWLGVHAQNEFSPWHQKGVPVFVYLCVRVHA